MSVSRNFSMGEGKLFRVVGGGGEDLEKSPKPLKRPPKSPKRSKHNPRVKPQQNNFDVNYYIKSDVILGEIRLVESIYDVIYTKICFTGLTPGASAPNPTLHWRHPRRCLRVEFVIIHFP